MNATLGQIAIQGQEPLPAVITVIPKTSEEKPRHEVADIFRLYGDAYRANNSLSDQQSKAMFDIVNCRTATFGYHADECDECGHVAVAYNSCRNRHCPKCQGSKRFKWVQDRLDDLLPVPYYHVVFTLPNQIFHIAIYNQRIIYDLLFACAAATLMQFASNPRWWNLSGKKPSKGSFAIDLGFFGILHTWGQTLVFHPHIHFIVLGGGLNAFGEWIWPQYESEFLFPIKAMAQVFRGKFIEGLKEAYYGGKLEFPGDLGIYAEVNLFESWIDELVNRDWVTYSKPPFAGPEKVIEYVSRYTHRVAISNHRITSVDNGEISFTYKDYKDNGAHKEMTLEADEFIHRFLYHILPERYHRIRHYGFLANGNTDAKEAAREAVIIKEERCNEENEQAAAAFRARNECSVCPYCGNGRLTTFLVVDGFGRVVNGEESPLHLQYLAMLKEDTS